MQLFHPDVDLPGTTLYTDLDVIITHNIDCFFTYKPEVEFMGMNDFNPTSGVFNSSIMRFDQSKMHDKLWRRFRKDRANLLRRFLVTKTLFQSLLRAVLDVIHFLIRGHNHISGMTEVVPDTPDKI